MEYITVKQFAYKYIEDVHEDLKIIAYVFNKSDRMMFLNDFINMIKNDMRLDISMMKVHDTYIRYQQIFNAYMIMKTTHTQQQQQAVMESRTQTNTVTNPFKVPLSVPFRNPFDIFANTNTTTTTSGNAAAKPKPKPKPRVTANTRIKATIAKHIGVTNKSKPVAVNRDASNSNGNDIGNDGVIVISSGNISTPDEANLPRTEAVSQASSFDNESDNEVLYSSKSNRVLPPLEIVTPKPIAQASSNSNKRKASEIEVLSSKRIRIDGYSSDETVSIDLEAPLEVERTLIIKVFSTASMYCILTCRDEALFRCSFNILSKKFPRMSILADVSVKVGTQLDKIIIQELKGKMRTSSKGSTVELHKDYTEEEFRKNVLEIAEKNK